MNSHEYLPLAEYAAKYRVSISTLRRRIKAEDIPFEFKEGKYLILDQPVSTHQRSASPSPKKSTTDSLVSAQQKNSAAALEDIETVRDDESPGAAEPILSTANRLLTELKKAYTQILQEKEDQILHLREELSDLRTLARVLEEENDRLKALSKRC